MMHRISWLNDKHFVAKMVLKLTCHEVAEGFAGMLHVFRDMPRGSMDNRRIEGGAFEAMPQLLIEPPGVSHPPKRPLPLLQVSMPV